MSRSKYLRRAIHFTCAAAAVSVAAPLFAADVDLTEVVVTAQKREESLTETPIAISAFTSEKRDQIGVTSVVDMANFTPGFVYNQGQDRVTLRGIGRYTNQLGADSSVGVYEDGAFETFTVKAGNSSLYTDRIEILRGPQGTLYGRNSIGGAVNIISRRPTKEWYGEVRVSLDNYNQHIEEGALSGPIGSSSSPVQFRLVATKLDQTKGYFTNVGGGRSSGNVRDEWAYEGQIAWQITEKDDLWLKLFGGQWDNGGGNAGGRTGNQQLVGLDGKTLLFGAAYPANLIPTNAGYGGYTLTSDALVPSLGFGFLVPHTGPNPNGQNPGNYNIRNIYSTFDQYVKLDDYYGAIVHYDHHFSGADLKYIGSAQHYNYFEGVDWGEGYPLSSGLTSYTVPNNATVYPGSILYYGEKHSLNSNEINLISTTDSPLQYVFGIYNFNEYYMQPEEVATPYQTQLTHPYDAVAAPGTLAPANPHNDVIDWHGNGGARTWAGYGQLDWSFTDAWKYTLGLRYSKDWKWGDDLARYFIFNPALGVGLDITRVPGVVPSTTAFPGATAPVFNSATGYMTRRLESDWSGVTGTTGFQWTPDKSTNVYFKYSRGYKSGGFNSGFGLAANPRTDPEHSNDFQFGYKQTFGRSFQFNLDLFYDEYLNAQIPTGVSNGGVVSTFFYNVPKARSDGAEVEMTWQATSAWQMILNYGYNDTKILNSGCIVDANGDPQAVLIGATRGNCPIAPVPSGALASGVQQSQDLSGNQLPNAPTNKAAFNTNYTIDFGGSSLTLSGSYIYRDRQFGSIFNRPYTQAPAWTQTDLRLMLKTMQDHLTLIAFCKNVFDQVGYTLGANAVRQNAAAPNADGSVNAVGWVKNYQLTPPRLIGGEIQYKF